MKNSEFYNLLSLEMSPFEEHTRRHKLVYALFTSGLNKDRHHIAFNQIKHIYLSGEGVVLF